MRWCACRARERAGRRLCRAAVDASAAQQAFRWVKGQSGGALRRIRQRVGGDDVCARLNSAHRACRLPLVASGVRHEIEAVGRLRSDSQSRGCVADPGGKRSRHATLPTLALLPRSFKGRVPHCRSSPGNRQARASPGQCGSLQQRQWRICRLLAASYASALLSLSWSAAVAPLFRRRWPGGRPASVIRTADRMYAGMELSHLREA